MQIQTRLQSEGINSNTASTTEKVSTKTGNLIQTMRSALEEVNGFVLLNEEDHQNTASFK